MFLDIISVKGGKIDFWKKITITVTAVIVLASIHHLGMFTVYFSRAFDVLLFLVGIIKIFTLATGRKRLDENKRLTHQGHHLKSIEIRTYLFSH